MNNNYYSSGGEVEAPMDPHPKKVRANDPELTNHKLWSSGDGLSFFPVADTTPVLPPDVYECRLINGMPFFYKVNFSSEELLRFEDSTIDDVVSEIEEFWRRKEKFKKFEFPYRRGILLYGPPGAGKTCTLKLIIQKVIKLGGIAVRFDDVNGFIECMRALRRIQPETPVVALMEDIESLTDRGNSSALLNLLDGVHGFDNIVYLATTNYPEQLEGRLSNRPSRFDRRYHIDFPSEKSRKMYIEYLCTKLGDEEDDINVEKWVKDTHKFTPSHMKELFISVILFGTEYNKALKIMKDMMTRKISSEQDGIMNLGFTSREMTGFQARR